VGTRCIEAINPVIERGNPSGGNPVEAKELFIDSIERQFLLHVPNTVDLIKKLARADFESTLKVVDQFERPEIRLFARLRLVQALLDPEAAEKEKKTRERISAGDEDH
jgi:hypothetical protein